MKRLFAGALALALIGPGAAQAEPVKVKIGQGVLVGDQAAGLATYRGIPFAAPPVGDLRWKPPGTAPTWAGERAATEYPASCVQPTRGGPKPSEDCLYLNVTAPAGAKGAPVMVWIHGGSNTGGSGPMYDSPAFAKDGIVYVSINYRLGPLGFFAHPAITAAAGKDEPLANYGLMD